MSRLKDRRRRAGRRSAAPTTGYRVEADEDEPADNPPIVAETKVDIPDASVSDAVMMLDLRNTNACCSATVSGKFNMVYRRGDGRSAGSSRNATERDRIYRERGLWRS